MPPSPLLLAVGYGETLTCAAIESFAETPTPLPTFAPGSSLRIAQSYADFQRHEATGTPIYGTTTGFGPHVVSPGGDADEQGAALIAHLAAGYGKDVPPEIVRAAMLLRLHTVGQGFSGVSPGAAEAYRALLESAIVPCVPETGSVGASGDLVPLAHIARVLTGDGSAYYAGERLAARAALESAGVLLRTLSGRDALALVNGTSFLCAYAALAAARAERLLRHAETLTGWLYRLLGAQADALDETLHRLRGHDAQRVSAANIREEAQRFGADYTDFSRPLQEVYSLRCAAQVLGACRGQYDYARAVVEAEIAGIDDNPVITPDCVLHGGNFHAQAVAFAADALNAALTQTAVLAERQVALLCLPSRHNDFAPLLLTYEPGKGSGLSGAQLTATALVAEMRAACQHHATLSIPTNADNQDIVPMGTLAAQAAFRQTERLAGVLAVLAIAAHQLAFLRAEGKAVGSPSPAPPHLPTFAPLRADRALQGDIARFAAAFLTRTG